MSEVDSEKTAYLKGLSDAKIEAQLAEHDRHLAVINGSIMTADKKLDALHQSIENINSTLIAISIKAELAAENAKTQAEKQVSTRAYFLGVGMLVVAIVALFARSLGL